MIVNQAGDTGDDAGYQIQRSLRFRRSASAYLSRAFSNGSSTQWTHSHVFKRGTIDAYEPIFITSLAGGEGAYLHSDNTLVISINGAVMLKSNRVFRDPSAHIHLVLVSDMGNATATLKFRVYVNNEEITSWSTDTRASYSSWTYWNSSAAAQHYIGYSNALGAYADSYRSEVVHVDAQVLTPSSFGSADLAGNWKPKKYSGAYGITGFYLDFSDATSTATLMADRSGNGNNWTANNISLTAGATYDSMLDVPLGGGGGERGNYCTLSPIDTQSVTVGEGNLQAALGATTAASIVGTQAVSTGKWYWEVIYQSSSSDSAMIGVVDAATTNFTTRRYQFAGTWYYFCNNGNKYIEAVVSTYGSPATTNDVIGVALDCGAGTLEIFKNGVSQGVMTSVLAGKTLFPALNNGGSGANTLRFNFGQRPFAYTPPTGFKALHTDNLNNVTVTTSGSFTGNVSTDGPSVWCNGSPETLTINGNAVTWGTHADKTAGGFKIRTSSSSYNASGSNSWTATYLTPSSNSAFKYQLAKGN